MELKILCLIFIFFICQIPILLNKILDNPEQDKVKKPRRHYRKWTGPKTDARINQMLAECIILLTDLGVPIAQSICPEVRLTGTHCYFGRCCRKGSLKQYNSYDYYIEISGHTLQNTERSLRNTLIHELLHTVPDGLCHTGEWKKWAKFVSGKTGYKIQRIGGGDDTPEDIERLEGVNPT